MRPVSDGSHLSVRGVIMPRPGSTTARGYGNQHDLQRDRLLAAHVDGTPCPCTDCGPACLCRDERQPMYRDAALNPDGLALDADHTGEGLATRLMLATCNRSSGGRLAHAPKCEYHTACGSVHSKAW